MLPHVRRGLADSQGNLKPFATVSVTREVDGEPQTLYSDRDAQNALGSVFTALSNGLADFYLPPGDYRFLIAYQGQTSTWRYLFIPPLGEIISEATTDRTSTVVDIGNYILWNNAGACTYTVLDAAFKIGDEVHIRQYGAGNVTIAGETAVTIQPPAGGTLITNGQGATVTLKKVAANTFILIGHTQAA